MILNWHLINCAVSPIPRIHGSRKPRMVMVRAPLINDPLEKCLLSVPMTVSSSGLEGGVLSPQDTVMIFA